MNRARLIRFLAIAAVALGAWAFFARDVPKDQSVNIVLGDSAPRVREVALTYGDEREVVFAFPAGSAPRILHHTPRLPDGEYAVHIEVRGDKDKAAVDRRIALRSEGSTSIDVSQTIALAP